MAKQRAPLEFNSIAGGIITEASALTFPDNASLDESNFELNKDGKRKRRLGFEQESFGVYAELEKVYSSVNPDTINSFLWSNVGGRATEEISVIQVGDTLHFYQAWVDPLSSAKLSVSVKVEGAGDNLFSFAAVEGDLVVATGLQEIITVSPVFDKSTRALIDFDTETSRLTIRDLFGIQVKYNRAVEDAEVVDPVTDSDYIDITLPEYITKRPLLDGLPSATSPVTLIPFQSSGTSTWTTLEASGAYGTNARKTVSTGSTSYKHTFLPSGLAGYDISSIHSGAITDTDYQGNPIPGAPVEEYNTVIFTTSPTFDSFTLVNHGTGQTYVYTRDDKGKQYYGDGLGVTVPEPLDLSLSVDVASVSSTLYNYNLRNQTFSAKRLTKAGVIAIDPITNFFTEADKMPSMSDTVLSALYPNIDATNKTVDRFHAEDLLENPLGSAPSPKGYFIIDALARSDSRQVRWQELADDQGYSGEVAGLPLDATPGGPKAIAEYAGRVWYGGFSEDGAETEEGGARLESYLLYSQLANSKSVLTRCYQQGDPTSPEAPELLDTDGGFLSLEGAYGISSIIPLGNSLLAFGANGVWAVTGNDGNYFTPTSPRVQLVTSKGSISPRAIVVIDSVVMYWTRDGIYLIAQGELGAYKVESLTDKTIQTLYTGIPLDVRERSFGEYDSFTSKVSWFLYNTTDRAEPTQVLSLLTTTGAFTMHTISEGAVARTLVGPAEVSPFTLGQAINEVIVGDKTVVVGTAQVAVGLTSSIGQTISVKGIYLEREEVTGNSLLSFGEFSNQDFKDWAEVDAPAYLVTGYVSGGDFQRYKQIPYVTFHFDRTEDGFELDGTDIVPSNQSGCLVQAQWEWADSVNSGRWGRTFQAYRYKRVYMPEDVNDPYDYGFSTIVTKSKIRGKGKVLSLKIETEPGKDCRLLGWSAIMEVNSNV